MELPTEPTPNGQEAPSAQASLPSSELIWENHRKMLERAFARVAEKAKEAADRGVPLIELVPVH
jgi:hypothetical protein